MKVSFLPFFATALPLLLVQHATQVNAAALCIPGLYCPQGSTAPASAPACTTAGGHPPPSSSSTGGSGDPATTYHSTVTVTVTTSLPPYTSTAAGPAGGSSSSATATDPGSGTSPTATATGPGGGTPSTATGTGPAGGASSTASVDPTYVPGGGSSSVGATPAGGSPPVTTTVTVSGDPQPTSGGSCNTGPVQCCNSVQPSSSKDASSLLGLLGVVVQGANVPIGINCTPISIIGAGTAGNCNAQTVCCENNNFNGLVNIGCTPINLGL